MSRSRRSRVPGTRARKTLYVLPEIRDDDPVKLKNALAVRNACAATGVCPACKAVGVIVPDAEFKWITHYVFEHESWCVVLADGDAA